MMRMRIRRKAVMTSIWTAECWLPQDDVSNIVCILLSHCYASATMPEMNPIGSITIY